MKNPYIVNKAVLDGSVSNIHLVILQSLGDNYFLQKSRMQFKKSRTDKQTDRHTEAIKAPSSTIQHKG